MKHGKNAQGEEGAVEDGEHGNAVSGNVVYKNAVNVLHAESVAHGDTDVGAGYAEVGGSGGGGGKGVDSACDSTASDGYELVPGSALQQALCGA